MPTRPIQIALSAAATGMTLSDPVLDTKGNVLLPQGTALTATLIASLARHQIDTIAILTEAPSQADADAERARRIDRVERLFRPHGQLGTTTATPQATDTLHRLIHDFRSGKNL